MIPLEPLGLDSLRPSPTIEDLDELRIHVIPDALNPLEPPDALGSLPLLPSIADQDECRITVISDDSVPSEPAPGLDSLCLLPSIKNLNKHRFTVIPDDLISSASPPGLGSLGMLFSIADLDERRLHYILDDLIPGELRGLPGFLHLSSLFGMQILVDNAYDAYKNSSVPSAPSTYAMMVPPVRHSLQGCSEARSLWDWPRLSSSVPYIACDLDDHRLVVVPDDSVPSEPPPGLGSPRPHTAFSGWPPEPSIWPTPLLQLLLTPNYPAPSTRYYQPFGSTHKEPWLDPPQPPCLPLHGTGRLSMHRSFHHYIFRPLLHFPSHAFIASFSNALCRVSHSHTTRPLASAVEPSLLLY